MNFDEIVLELRETLKKSHSPYSKIKVAAAIKYKSSGVEKIEYGTNVENISYGLTNCAERSAVFTAVSNGLDEIKEIYVMSNLDEPITPCGACRQVLSEFIKIPKEVNVICLNENAEKKEFSFEYLLPERFE